MRFSQSPRDRDLRFLALLSEIERSTVNGIHTGYVFRWYGGVRSSVLVPLLVASTRSRAHHGRRC